VYCRDGDRPTLPDPVAFQYTHADEQTDMLPSVSQELRGFFRAKVFVGHGSIIFHWEYDINWRSRDDGNLSRATHGLMSLLSPQRGLFHRR